MANFYKTCRHCVYCHDADRITTCIFHKKTIDPGVACCDDVVYNRKGLSKLSKKQRKKLAESPIIYNQGQKNKK